MNIIPVLAVDEPMHFKEGGIVGLVNVKTGKRAASLYCGDADDGFADEAEMMSAARHFAAAPDLTEALDAVCCLALHSKGDITMCPDFKNALQLLASVGGAS
jgi:hypothetical protein